MGRNAAESQENGREFHSSWRVVSFGYPEYEMHPQNVLVHVALPVDFFRLPKVILPQFRYKMGIFICSHVWNENKC